MEPLPFMYGAYFLMYRTQMSQSFTSTDFICKNPEYWRNRQEILFLLGYLLTWVVSRSRLSSLKSPGQWEGFKVAGLKVDGVFKLPWYDGPKQCGFEKGQAEQKNTCKKSLSETSFLRFFEKVQINTVVVLPKGHCKSPVKTQKILLSQM